MNHLDPESGLDKVLIKVTILNLIKVLIIFGKNSVPYTFSGAGAWRQRKPCWVAGLLMEALGKLLRTSVSRFEGQILDLLEKQFLDCFCCHSPSVDVLCRSVES